MLPYLSGGGKNQFPMYRVAGKFGCIKFGDFAIGLNAFFFDLTNFKIGDSALQPKYCATHR